VKPDHQLHVLAYRPHQEATGLQHRGPAEQPEGAGDDQQALEVAPTRPAGEERAGVLQDLEPLQPSLRHAQLGDLAALHLRGVEGSDGAAHRHQVLVLDEQPGGPQDRLGVQHRVGVDRGEQREAGEVETGVERVGLAAVVLVDHQQVGVGEGAVGAADGGGLQVLAGEEGLLRQGELVDQPLHRLVAGAVGDHDDLELRELEGEQRLYVGDDAHLLVVGGHQDRHRFVDVALQQVTQGALGELPGEDDHDGAQPEAAEQRVEEIQPREVDQQDVLVEGQRSVPHGSGHSLDQAGAGRVQLARL
jgi:hypothetical protein